MSHLATVALLFSVAQLLQALPDFKDKIPNGHNVPNPCKPGEMWDAVGHLVSDDGCDGCFNAFGRRFDRVRKRWTKDFCREDSDGDGRSNGLELGDPDCVWQPGDQPTLTTGLSHPGICEPLTSPNCTTTNSRVYNFTAQACPSLFVSSSSSTTTASTTTFTTDQPHTTAGY